MQDYDLQNGICVSNGPGVNVIAIAFGAAGGVVFLVIVGNLSIIQLF